MPIGSDPQNDTTPVVLPTDKGRIAKAKKDGQEPPTVRTWTIRFLTNQELRKAIAIRRKAAQAEKDEKIDERDAALDELFALCLTGWENVTFRGTEMKSGADKPQAFLSDFDLWDLIKACIEAPQLAEEDLRNFGLPSAHDGAAPADVPAANAQTPPPQQIPSV